MKLILVENLESGMKIARTIYGKNGQVLLSAGMKIKKSYINQLKGLNIKEVYIVDENFPDLQVPEPISDKTRTEAIKTVKKTMESIKNGANIDYEEVSQVVDSILDELLLQNNVIIHLNDIRGYDDYTFKHSVGVTIISILIALDTGFTLDEVKKIALGAFLHDIGKIKINKDIIMKPGKLNDEEYEIVKKHSKYGYDIIRKQKRINVLSAHVAYQHHEYLDGSGYPRGLKGDEILKWAQIVTVADIYDALTSDRVYKKMLMPYEALKIIDELKGTKLNPEYVAALFKHIAAYPVGTIVKLNNEEEGMVVDVNKEDLSSPIIRLIKDSNGEVITEIKEVDLVHNKSLKIVKTI
ncbi:HD-GYP domain-containing protein [Halonatronum saccharophilum]|uniref:HD-GYP domain-containing protein n=1 Tax=Halonatronum saccharophilum TaxID=150060 RepID=UPI00048464A6|nr:HD-GYP domain-containing protein [Halonatronum saccharophilum]